MAGGLPAAAGCLRRCAACGGIEFLLCAACLVRGMAEYGRGRPSGRVLFGATSVLTCKAAAVRGW